MSLSNIYESLVLKHLTGEAVWTAPAALYVSLHTADPGETGLNEVSGNGYARVLIGVGAANWTESAGTTVNDNALTFTGPTPATWGTVTHWGVWDAVTAGNYVVGSALTQTRVTAVGVNLAFAAGQLTVSAD